MDPTGQIPYWEDQAACANPPEEIRKGDVVMYARAFLRSTGQYTGPIPFMKGMVVDVEKKKGMPDVAHVLWNYEDPSEEVMHRVLVTNLVKKSRLHLERNPGDIHIDIGSHNEKNPPLNKEEDSFNKHSVGRFMRLPDVKYAEVGRMGTGEFFYEVGMKDGTMRRAQFDTFHELERGVDAEFVHLRFSRIPAMDALVKNPPLPASALMDVATAKTVAREVEEGARPMGNLATVDHLLDRGLQKLRGSHLGNVDWQNPPLEILSDNMVGKLRVIHYRITVPMKDTKEAEKILHTLYPAWRVRSHYSLRPDAYPGTKHAYGVQMAISHDRRNPGVGKIRYYKPAPKSSEDSLLTDIRNGIVETRYLMAKLHKRGIVSDHEFQDIDDAYTAFMLLERRAAEGRFRTNPPAAIQKEIYRDIVEIKAIKPDGKRYVHKFGLGSNIYGMSDGTILIRSRKGKRLWKNFPTEG